AVDLEAVYAARQAAAAAEKTAAEKTGTEKTAEEAESTPPGAAPGAEGAGAQDAPAGPVTAVAEDTQRIAVPDFIVRFAALMHDIGKPSTRRFTPDGAVTFYHHDVVGAKMTRKRMKALRFDKATTKAVSRLVELHLRFYGYGDAGWTDSAVRRYVTDAGELLTRLHILTRSDVTTRNRRKAERLAHAYDDLEHRIEKLAEREKLDAVRPDLDGRQIMDILGISPGPAVGQAYQFLLAQRMEHGPLGQQRAEEVLRQWWAEQDGGSSQPQ
ncbi:HDIG domain-containing metalloprotein, partial [Brevibacterium luteolum]